MERIFQYGMSGGATDREAAQTGQRGRALLMAHTYMSKMGGTIEARNDAGGVSLALTVHRAG